MAMRSIDHIFMGGSAEPRHSFRSEDLLTIPNIFLILKIVLVGLENILIALILDWWFLMIIINILPWIIVSCSRVLSIKVWITLVCQVIISDWTFWAAIFEKIKFIHFIIIFWNFVVVLLYLNWPNFIIETIPSIIKCWFILTIYIKVHYCSRFNIFIIKTEFNDIFLSRQTYTSILSPKNYASEYFLFFIELRINKIFF